MARSRAQTYIVIGWAIDLYEALRRAKVSRSTAARMIWLNGVFAMPAARLAIHRWAALHDGRSALAERGKLRPLPLHQRKPARAHRGRACRLALLLVEQIEAAA